MACRGVLFAITEEEKQRLLGAKSDADVLNIVVDDIEENWDEEHLEQVDKAWDAMHRCLSDGTLAWNGGSEPLNLCIIGGKSLHKGADYIVTLKEPEQVDRIAVALPTITKAWMRERYYLIDPKDYGVPLVPFNDQDFEYTWEYFEGMRKFYLKAAADNRAVIFTADQ